MSQPRKSSVVEQILLAILAACVLSALYVLPAGVRSPGYFPILRVHLVSGLALLALFIPGVLFHIVRNPDRRAVPALASGAGATAAVAAGLVFLDGSDDVGSGEIGRVLAWASIGTLAVLAGALAIRKSHRGGAITGAGLVLGHAAALISGLIAWALRGDGRFPVQHAHSLLGILGIGLLVPHLRWPRRWIRGEQLRAGTVASLTIASATGVWVAVVLLETVVPAQRLLPLKAKKAFVVPMTAAERRAPPARTIDEALLNDSASCGVEECHPTITKQWDGSAHRFSADNDLYRFVVARLVEERGVHEAVFCANCHDPVRVLAGTVPRDYADGAPPPGEGVNCLTCHLSIREIDPDAPGNGGFVYRAPFRYPGATVEQRNANILLDPRRHRAGFEVDGYSTSGPMCGACHRVQLSPDMGAAITGAVQVAIPQQEDLPADCNHCHMPTTTPVPGLSWVLGLDSPPLYDHHMVAMNSDLPLYASHPDANQEALLAVARRAEDFRQGRIDHPDAIATYDEALRSTAYMETVARALNGGPVLKMELDVAPERAGLRLRVVTHHDRAAHAFPIGPFDLQEIWQEVTVRDAHGRLLFHRGGLDAEDRVDPLAHRLGGVEWQRDGRHLQQHRVWDVAGLTDVRQIDPDGSVSDTYELVLPDETAGPVHIEVGWNLRRVNPDFAREVYGPEGKRFPVHRLATVESDVPRRE